MKKKVFTMILAVLCAFSFAQAATYSGGNGTPATPYLISSATDLQTLSATPADWGQSFRLTTNVTVADLSPIGTSATYFSGTFDGNAKVITHNVSAQRDWITGLFGYNSGTITNLTVNGTIAAVEPVPALGSGWLAGIVAINMGTVSDSTYSGTINLDTNTSGDGTYNVYVGGIAAENTGTIIDSSFAGYIGGNVYDAYVAGIAGVNTGTIDGASVGGFATVFVGSNYNFASTTFTVSGAVAGYNGGTILDSDVAAGVFVDNQAWAGFTGGFVGYNEGDITNNSSMANVFFGGTQGVVGGFCGWNYGTISESFAEGDVVVAGSGSRIGGFVGVNSGTSSEGIISKSYFFGDVDFVNQGSNVGLFVGTNSSGAAIDNSFAIGNMAANPNTVLAGVIGGGFAGVNDAAATITNSYAVDKDAKSQPPYAFDNATFVGGVAGYVESGMLAGTVWNQTTSALATGAGAGSTAGTLGETTADMKLQATFTALGWDFATVWGMSDAGSQFEGYPILTQTQATQTINLYAGWTWISFNVLPANPSVTNVFADFAANTNDVIVAQNGQNATWTGSAWIGTLTTIEGGKGYKYYSATAGSFTVTGSYVDTSTPITLVTGWNWLGYTPASAQSITTALASVALTDGDVITSQTGQNATYIGGTWIGSLTQLEPGISYMFNVAQAQTFSYSGIIPADSDGISTSSVINTLVTSGPGWTNPTGLANFMMMYARVTDVVTSDMLGTSAGSLLSAWFPNGDIAGVVEVSGTGSESLFMLTVFSDAGSVSDMTLKLYDAVSGTVMDINETFDFQAYDFLGTASEPEMFTAGSLPSTVTVTFDAGANGTITAGDAVQVIDYNTSAVAPTVTPNTGWNFDGWDVSFTNVTSDITVTAQYSIETFTVTFDAGANGTITAGDATQTVNYGDAAVAPTITPAVGWNFDGWDVNFANVTDDLTVTAQYSVQTFTVTFVAGTNGTITAGDDTQTVNYGDAAIQPTITANSGWVFTGWDEDFSNITDDLTVTAQYVVYVPPTYTVNFDLADGATVIDGSLSQQILEGGSATAPVVLPNYGNKLEGWTVAFDNVMGNITTVAVYSQIDIDGIDCSAADLNGDTYVNEEDIILLANDWLSNGDELTGDVIGNDWVNQWDYEILSDCWLASLSSTLTYDLVAGWNWLSFNILPEPANLVDVMADYNNIVSEGDVIVSSDGKNATYSSGNWIGTLTTIQAGKMYRLRSISGGSFTVSGSEVDASTPITLVNGWNWLGYTPQEARPIATAFASMNLSNNDVITDQFGKNAAYLGGSWVGNLTQIEPGRGYMIKLANAQTFSYDNLVLTSMDASISMSTQDAPATWVNPTGLNNQMMIYGQVYRGVQQMGVAAGSKLSVWTPGGTIAGVADVVTVPGVGEEFIITVYSDAASVSDMTLKLYDAGTDTVYDIIETVDFVSGDIVSTAFTPEIYNIPDNWVSPVGLNHFAIGIIQVFDGATQIATAPGSMLSIWNTDGTIAGVATIQDAGVDGMIFVITVYSDVTPVNGMTLKVYDAATDTYYDLDGTFDFNAFEITGLVDAPIPYYISGSTPALNWFEEDTAVAPTNWTVAGADLVSGPTGAMSGSGVSSAAIDVSAFTNATFDVQTDTGSTSYLIFGITDNAGVYHMVDYWSGVTPVTPVMVNLAPYTAAGNTITFHWTYSKGRNTVGADTVWVWNFQLN